MLVGAGSVRLWRARMRPPILAASMYAFRSLHNPASPLDVPVVLKFLKAQLDAQRHYPSARTKGSWSESWRVAEVEGNELGIGGGLPVRDEGGRISKVSSPWFAVRLSLGTAGWRTCLLGTGSSFGLASFCTGECSMRRPSSFGFPDNKSNGYVVSKLNSTRFPIGAVLIELTAQMEHTSVWVDLCWTSPRDRNVHADALSNFEFPGFKEQLRVQVCLAISGLCVWNFLSSVRCFRRRRRRRRRRVDRIQREAAREERGWDQQGVSDDQQVLR